MHCAGGQGDLRVTHRDLAIALAAAAALASGATIGVVLHGDTLLINSRGPGVPLVAYLKCRKARRILSTACQK